MKIKNLSWLILIASAIGTVGYEIINFLNGNVSSTYNTTTILITLAAFALLVIFALIDKKTMTYYKFKKNAFSGVTAILSGLGLCFIAANEITKISEEIDIISILNIVFSLIGAIGIFVLGMFSITGKYNNKSIPFISTLPVSFGLYKLITYFIMYTKQSLSVSMFYDIFAVISMLLFLFYSASVKSKIPNKSAVKCTFIYGSTAILCSVLWVTDIILSNQLSLKSLLVYSDFDAVLYLLFSLYALSTMLEITLNIGTKSGYELEDEDFSEEEQIFGKIIKKNHTYQNNKSNNEAENESKIDYSSLLKDEEELNDNENAEDEDWLNQLNDILSDEKK